MSIKHPEQAFIPAFCAPLAVFLTTLFAEVVAMVIALVHSPLPDFDWLFFGQASLFIVWLALLAAGLLCLLRRPLEPLPLSLQIGLAYGVIVWIAALLSVTCVVLLDYSWWILLNNVLLTVVIVGIAMRYFVLHYQFRLQQQAELKQRLEALQARIRPHFLFNALNAIATMIDIEPAKAEAMTLDLADITRDSLQQAALVTVADELDVCRRYLAIEAYRFGARLEQQWAIDDAVLAHTMPNFVLQPLLENAIYHGIQRCRDGGTVSISASCVANTVRIVIENPLPDDGAAEVKGQQIALANIEHRLAALYEARARCELTAKATTFVATLTIPITTAEQGEKQA